MSLTPKNWNEFQHYKDRAPIWIKLHRTLLDDFTFARLPVASKALAPMLWLLASEYEEGKITASMEEIAFRLRSSEKEVSDALKPLVNAGFFIDDSALLADCEHDAMPEKRREETEKKIVRPRDQDDSDFEDWYRAYPKHEARGGALKAYRTARKSTDAATLLAGAERAKQKYAGSDRKFIPLPATWLNQQRWLDEAPQNVSPLRRGIEGIV